MKVWFSYSEIPQTESGADHWLINTSSFQRLEPIYNGLRWHWAKHKITSLLGHIFHKVTTGNWGKYYSHNGNIDPIHQVHTSWGPLQQSSESDTCDWCDNCQESLSPTPIKSLPLSASSVSGGGEYNANLASIMDWDFFLAYFVTFLSKISTFCHFSEQNLVHFPKKI